MSAPAIERGTTEDLQTELEEARKRVADIQARLEAGENFEGEAGQKRARPEGTDEKTEEPSPKKQKQDEADDDQETEEEGDYYSSNNEAADAQEEQEADDEVIADGTTVAVAYGNLDGLSKRKWYAGKVIAYIDANESYQVKWKYPPRGKNKIFLAASHRVRVIDEEDYNRATKKGTGFVGLHRAESFVTPSAKDDGSDDADSDEEFEGPQVGDYVAVAYGASRAAKRGKDKTGKNERSTEKYHKRHLWYAATVTAVDGEQVEVEWKFPSTKVNTFNTTSDKVQVITKSEFKRSRKVSRGKPSYGLIGLARVGTKASLTSG